MPDARVPPGTVLAQDPGPHAQGAERPSISLLIADADPAKSPAFVMPDEIGRPFDEAIGELEKAGLHVQKTVGAKDGSESVLAITAQPGAVVEQTPAAGEKIDAATPITLFEAANK